jgi:pimeloyl-ACP methyl ester carboxylesterase
MMKTVTSKDGTRIAYDQTGRGDPVILVGGAFSYRKYPDWAKMVELLSPHFTVINYDRRGRGDSGDTQPYAVRREVEDIEALIDAVGGTAYVYGLSSGAALALETANAMPGKVKKLALYEAPFVVDNTGRPLPKDFVPHLQQLLADGRQGDVVKAFMVEVDVPAIFITLMSLMRKNWNQLKSLAHTVPYDITILGDHRSGKPLPKGEWAKATMPTLVMDGGKSPTGMRHGMEALAANLPNATYRTLPGQTHMIKAPALAPTLIEFFAGNSL